MSSTREPQARGISSEEFRSVCVPSSPPPTRPVNHPRSLRSWLNRQCVRWLPCRPNSGADQLFRIGIKIHESKREGHLWLRNVWRGVCVENRVLCQSKLPRDMYDFLDASIMCQASPEVRARTHKRTSPCSLTLTRLSFSARSRSHPSSWNRAERRSRSRETALSKTDATTLRLPHAAYKRIVSSLVFATVALQPSIAWQLTERKWLYV